MHLFIFNTTKWDTKLNNKWVLALEVFLFTTIPITAKKMLMKRNQTLKKMCVYSLRRYISTTLLISFNIYLHTVLEYVTMSVYFNPSLGKKVLTFHFKK